MVLLTGPQYHSLHPGQQPAAVPPLGHAQLRERAAAALGPSHVYFPTPPFDPAVQTVCAPAPWHSLCCIHLAHLTREVLALQLPEYFGGLTGGLRAHIATAGLEYDRQTVTSELWGESFEGCVPGYGGGGAPRMRMPASPPTEKSELLAAMRWPWQSSRRGSGSAGRHGCALRCACSTLGFCTRPGKCGRSHFLAPTLSAGCSSATTARARRCSSLG